MASYLDGRLLVRWAPVAVSEPLVRDLTRALTGRDPGPLHHHCARCGSIEHGRPYVEAPVHVSVAHAPGLTAVAVTDLGPVGVDVQAGDEDDWVRREAVGKALGTGLACGEATAPARILLQERLEIPGHAAVVVVLSASEAPAARPGTASP